MIQIVNKENTRIADTMIKIVATTIRIADAMIHIVNKTIRVRYDENS